MIVTKVVLQDYGVYRGKNEFDFACTKQKPIILVGGANGAGKTTLFESVMLCLYGMSTMPKRSTRRSYEKFLARKIHRYADGTRTADHAAITVQFKFFHNGRETEYRVQRFWEKVDGRIIEQLAIKKRDSGDDEFGPIGATEESHWQSFINDLIPQGIVKLFFFDGEKIVEMAKEDSEDVAIKESFKTLLGIEVVEQLRTDLQVNLARNLGGRDDLLQQEFARHTAEKDQCTSVIARLVEKQAQKQTELDRVLADLEIVEGNLAKIGGRFASKRSDNKTKLAVKKANYDAIKQKITELCAGVLPFSMIPRQLEALIRQIQDDESMLHDQMGQRLFQASAGNIKSEIKKPGFWRDSGLDSKTIESVSLQLSNLLDSELGRAAPDGKPVLGLSAEQASAILETSKKADTVVLESLMEHTKKITILDAEISDLESAIANAPNDDEIGPLVSEIGDLNSKIGMIRAEMEHIQEKISSNTSLKQHLNAKLRELVSQIYERKKSQQYVELTQRVQKVLDEFIESLKIKKIRLLEQYLLDATGVLMHKRHLVEDIKVDPETFVVTLFGKDGKPFHKDLLSEGEKQMFAMAILWALAKTSGRPLPFIIDTPLARLDEGHRTNIVERFLPAASHQIMIFSTDKEIERSDYQKLAPYLSRSYAMEYLEDEGCTRKHEGYFWNSEGERTVAI